ncbi:DUF3857 domain-containing protein [Taibaiella lutea]|uniref:DUF3857 domain-containing protein n=1 Tax=Taibaiella lutea TaxID=2608001 RepID=A0A5M6CMV6_9BACT|nr:DUF3857 domain-containing protein [Taibaiella lutea]KAA5534479.1 DUF3857 domain-containing protein [Taibaiella lutea]
MSLTFKSLLFASSLFLGHSLFAQNYHWDDVPKVQAVSDTFKKESAVFLLEKRIVKYVPAKNDDVDVYRTVHRIIKLMDDKGVEYFNKMTVSPAYGASIEAIKGRTIKANGKVIDLKNDQIKTKANENGDEQYHLAFEGIEKGDVVEMYYTEKRSFNNFGAEIMQFGLPVEHASFTLEVPAFWIFDAKGFNGFPDAKDTVIGKTRIYTADQYKLDAIEEETYSDLTPNLQREEYKFSYTGDSKSRLYTWNDMAKRMYENNNSFTEKEIKAVTKFLAPLKLDDKSKEEDKIIAIENFIKTNIVYDEKLGGEDYRNMNFILEKKTSSESGIIRLFIAAFQIAGVKHELGISSNRFEFPVDERFENWLRPDIYVFSFPNTKQYLDPVATTLRYPMIPSAIRENNAIFCKTITVGSLTSALASVRKIPQLDYTQSVNALDADVTFDNSMVPTVNLTEGFTGYRAIGIREISVYLTKDKEKEFVQNVSGIAQKVEDVKSYSFKNTGMEHYTDNIPVEVHCEIKAEQLMETAGDKWLFNVGDILGPQQEMYNEKKRKLPISFAFPHIYTREIVIHIPDGYKISNPEIVKMDAALSDNNMGFHSDYKIEGNKMTISINEFYKVTSLPVSEIEPFKKVVNAAADFNKVVLILVKK